jgi:hypothetical protein
MKTATLKKLVDKITQKTPIETGCRFHGNLVPSALVLDIRDGSRVTVTGESGARMEDDCLVLSTGAGSGAGIEEVYYSSDCIARGTLKYGEERS